VTRSTFPGLLLQFSAKSTLSPFGFKLPSSRLRGGSASKTRCIALNPAVLSVHELLLPFRPYGLPDQSAGSFLLKSLTYTKDPISVRSPTASIVMLKCFYFHVLQHSNKATRLNQTKQATLKLTCFISGWLHAVRALASTVRMMLARLRNGWSCDLIPVDSGKISPGAHPVSLISRLE
jgi:hypothetical protein